MGRILESSFEERIANVPISLKLRGMLKANSVSNESYSHTVLQQVRRHGKASAMAGTFLFCSHSSIRNCTGRVRFIVSIKIGTARQYKGPSDSLEPQSYLKDAC